MFDIQFWSRYFQRTFVPHLSLLLEVIEHRLLPTFDDIEQEAQAVADAEWKRLMHLSGDTDQDPSDFADQAFDVGLAHYEAMSGIQQALLNTFASTLYHVWEQQLLAFHRRQVLHPTEEDDNALLNLRVFKKRLSAVGIDITELPSWTQINELRLLSNTVKHADGSSADELKKLRPSLFEHPSTSQFGLPQFRSVRRVYMPLSGDDVFVTLEALTCYCFALIQFWSELANVLSHD